MEDQSKSASFKSSLKITAFFNLDLSLENNHNENGENKNQEEEDFKNIEQMQLEAKEKLETHEIDKAEKLISQRYPLNYLSIIEVFTFLSYIAFWIAKRKKKKQSEKFK
jgi:hypothetical protein